MTINVVFTGPARDADGNPVLRADLIAAAQQSGYRVQDRVDRDTQLLVASREDTVKWTQAAQRGVPVMTYPDFIRDGLTSPVSPTGAPACPYVDPYIPPDPKDWPDAL